MIPTHAAPLTMDFDSTEMWLFYAEREVRDIRLERGAPDAHERALARARLRAHFEGPVAGDSLPTGGWTPAEAAEERGRRAARGATGGPERR